jgi:hypothetical protein
VNTAVGSIRRRIAIVGTFPPPVHGMASMLAMLAEYLESDCEVWRISTVGPLALRPVTYLRCCFSLLRLFAFRKVTSAIVALNDNRAILLDCALIVIIRYCGIIVFFTLMNMIGECGLS